MEYTKNSHTKNQSSGFRVLRGDSELTHRCRKCEVSSDRWPDALRYPRVPQLSSTLGTSLLKQIGSPIWTREIRKPKLEDSWVALIETVRHHASKLSLAQIWTNSGKKKLLSILSYRSERTSRISEKAENTLLGCRADGENFRLVMTIDPTLETTQDGRESSVTVPHCSKTESLS